MTRSVIGRFASASLRVEGEYPLNIKLAGRRFARIEIRVTPEDYRDARFQAWLLEDLSVRLRAPDDVIVVTIGTDNGDEDGPARRLIGPPNS